MSRPSKIVYDPTLSVKENVEANAKRGVIVSEAGIYYYIRSHNLDRNQEKAEAIVANIKRVIKKHPGASQSKVAEASGYAIATVNKYWKVATGEKEFISTREKRAVVRKNKKESSFLQGISCNAVIDILKIENLSTDIYSPNSNIPFLTNGSELDAYSFHSESSKRMDCIGIYAAHDLSENLLKGLLSNSLSKVALLLPASALSDDAKYNSVFKKNSPTRVYIYTNSIGGYDNPMYQYAWYIWEKKVKQPTELRWIQSSSIQPIMPSRLSTSALSLKAKIDEIIEREHRNTAQLEDNPCFLPVPTKQDILSRNEESYDASKYLCVAFRSKNDLWKKQWVPLGNMNGGFPFSLNGVEFPTSENAYISGIFSTQSEEHISLQEQLVKETNGYMAKRNIRHKNKDLERSDWSEFNLDWMIYCVWQKVKGNEQFRKILMSLPKGVTIIEDSSFKNTPQYGVDLNVYWGARNEQRKEFGGLVQKYVKSLNLTNNEADTLKDELIWDYCNDGVFVGVNQMGKILTMIKQCLHDGTEPEINYKLLREKNIYLLGSKLTFTNKPTPSKKVRVNKQATRDQYVSVRDKDTERVYGVIGAIIGDIVGSRFEFQRTFPKYNFKWLGANNSFTDDTTLTIAIADAIMNGKPYNKTLHEWGKKYPNAGWGGSFRRWLKGSCNVVNTSAGNGCGMRISPIGFWASTIEEALSMAKEATIPTHNSYEGIKGAQAIAAAIFLARQNKPKEEIKSYIEKSFGYNLDMTKEDIISMVQSFLPHQGELAANSVPVSIVAFLNSTDYEDAIRLSISYGGDSDTIACMTGGIAAAYYGVPMSLANEISAFLPQEMLDIINQFDGTNLTRERITPKTYNRWGIDCVSVFGSGDERGESDAFIGRKYFSAGNHSEGLKKRSYTIPVIGKQLTEVEDAVTRFISFAKEHATMTFLVQRVGTSGAGFSVEQMAPLFKPLLSYNNVYLPKEYFDYIKDNNTEK